MTIAPLSDDDAPPEIREFFERIRGAIGFVPNLFRLWARAPHLVETLVQLETTVGGNGRVPARLKELAMLRTSELNGCPYCADFHSNGYAAAGGDNGQAEALKSRQLVPGLFTDEELAVLQLTDEMTLSVRGSPETVGKIIELFGVDGAVELMATIALLNFDNRMAFTANLPVDVR